MINLSLAINYLIPLLIVACSGFLGYVSIKKWLSEAYNHEQIFYWGVSFIILGLMALNSLSCVIFNFGIKNSVAMHIWVAIAMWFQIFAIASVKNTAQTERKKLRLIMWALFFVVATILSIVTSGFIHEKEMCACLASLQIIDSGPIDIIFESLYAATAFAIIIYLTPIKNICFAYFSMYCAFSIFFMSRITNVINTIVYGFSNSILTSVEWSLVTLTLISLTSAVYTLVMCDYKKNPM